MKDTTFDASNYVTSARLEIGGTPVASGSVPKTVTFEGDFLADDYKFFMVNRAKFKRLVDRLDQITDPGQIN